MRDEGVLENDSSSIWAVIALSDGGLNGFWPIWMAILVWMALSYAAVHLAAFLAAILALRHHKWMPIMAGPFLVSALLEPATLGALTSAFLALTFSTANKSVSSWHCALLGCSQTALIVLTSFLRVLAAL